MKKNLGKHGVWLRDKLDLVIRTVWETDGKMFIRYNGKDYEVKYNSKFDQYYTV